MADAVAADGQAAAPAAQGGAGQGSSIFATILRSLLIYFVISWLRGSAKTTPGGQQIMPKWTVGTEIDVSCYISESEDYSNLNLTNPLWVVNDLPQPPKEPIVMSSVYRPSQAVQHNASVFLHLAVSRAGSPIDRMDEDYNKHQTFWHTHRVNVYRPEKANKTGVHLLRDDAPAQPMWTLPPVLTDNIAKYVHKEEPAPPRLISYWPSNVTVAFIDDQTSYSRQGIPPQLANNMRIDTFDSHYFPTLHVHSFWLLGDKLAALNDTVAEVPLHVSLERSSQWYWMAIANLEQSFDSQERMGLAEPGASDDIKRVLTESNPYYLALTAGVSLLHSVFDFFAFKSDIGFWKNNKSMEGLSAQSICINAVCQLVIFLYLMDNQTSFVILASSFFGLLIEFWKITKAMDVSVAYWGSVPYLRFQDRQSYITSKTKEYDAIATRYLSYIMYPLVAGYTVYSLIYDTHSSWYSWILSSLVGAVYAFGFILMCPQLYLNYRLKSVAHMPWRQMSFKFLNTIIDDLFAFVIKMPLLHRLSVFRDDIIFLIFLYQRWIYRVDMTRVNEFGFSGGDGEAAPDSDAVGDTPPQIEGATPAEDASAAVIETTVTQRKGKGKRSQPAKAEGKKRS